MLTIRINAKHRSDRGERLFDGKFLSSLDSVELCVKILIIIKFGVYPRRQFAKKKKSKS